MHSGVAQHARLLLESLQPIDTEITLVGDESCLANFPNIRHLEIKSDGLLGPLSRLKPFWSSVAWREIKKDSAAFPGKPVVHGLSNINIPLYASQSECRRIITVHDLIPLLAPESVSLSYHWQFKMMMPLVLAQADHVVCVSKWTRDMLEFEYPQFSAKLQVIANGVPPLLALPPVKKQAKMTLLSVARFEEYKNLPWLLQLLRANAKNAVLQLVTDEAGTQWARQQAPDLIEYGVLRLHTNLSSKELAQAYRDADVYVHTSRYEGFGLPIVEAIAAGLPAVCVAQSGPDDYADQLICRTLSPYASIDEWQTAVAAAYELRHDSAFDDKRQAFYQKLPTWNEAAQLIKKLYTD